VKARVFLQQQRDNAQLIQIICYDEDTIKAVVNWIVNKNDTRQTGAEEGASNEGFNLEKYLMSMTIEELTEMLVEIKRPDLVSLLTKADSTILETKNQAKIMVVREDAEGDGHDGAVGISLNQQQDNDGVGYERVMTDVMEDKAQSHKPDWYFPENTGDFSTLNRVTEELQSPILKEKCTQTNSLSIEYEYKKERVSVEVQTESTQLVRILLLTFKNINSYHVTYHVRYAS
jgi:hypothetical protein